MLLICRHKHTVYPFTLHYSFVSPVSFVLHFSGRYFDILWRKTAGCIAALRPSTKKVHLWKRYVRGGAR
ncbi:hypothetical protein BS50DRAFT_199123 [Corynespora cassiicola Philippines]|uniref:Uncharacterized protein n=1 Tax=Corynespora cassiicola Philippines TaxID=1448308 RepID=A0A2T2N635_CORCC|nr:hypothetical protein BS50DRAFT_199123 [Corynespora cassiicola Philippines]